MSEEDAAIEVKEVTPGRCGKLCEASPQRSARARRKQIARRVGMLSSLDKDPGSDILSDVTRDNRAMASAKRLCILPHLVRRDDVRRDLLSDESS